MQKVDLTKQFAHRLKEAMLKAGFNSHRSVSGVSIQKLADITGYSLQICRKYLRGEAIPEPIKLLEIAQVLKVAPGWLLFGDAHQDTFDQYQNITISRNLIHYIFRSAADLYNHHSSNQEVAEFLMDLIDDISQINATEEQSKRIIDLALSSISHFRNPNKQ